VSPSKVPSKADEAERRRKATLEGTHLKGPPLDKGKKSLAAVPDDWVQKQCGLAEARVEALGKLLKSQDLDAKAVVRVLGQVRDILNRMACPPPPKAPSRNRGEKTRE
jgi:hypothetical protein